MWHMALGNLVVSLPYLTHLHCHPILVVIHTLCTLEHNTNVCGAHLATLYWALIGSIGKDFSEIDQLSLQGCTVRNMSSVGVSVWLGSVIEASVYWPTAWVAGLCWHVSLTTVCPGGLLKVWQFPFLGAVILRGVDGGQAIWALYYWGCLIVDSFHTCTCTL